MHNILHKFEKNGVYHKHERETTKETYLITKFKKITADDDEKVAVRFPIPRKATK